MGVCARPADLGPCGVQPPVMLSCIRWSSLLCKVWTAEKPPCTCILKCQFSSRMFYCSCALSQLVPGSEKKLKIGLRQVSRTVSIPSLFPG